MKKTLISILIISILLCTGFTSFADNERNNTETTDNSITSNNTDSEPTTKEEKNNSQEKLDNVKKSNFDSMMEFEPNIEVTDKSLSEGVDETNRKFRVAFEYIKDLWSEFSMIVTLIISFFCFFMALMFKVLRVPKGTKTFLFSGIGVILFWIAFMILPAFMDILR